MKPLRLRCAHSLMMACLLMSFLFPKFAYSQLPDTVFCEGWETGDNGWSATNGVWQTGRPTTAPPGNAHTGQNCAGTMLTGDYPANANSIWLSPATGISLPVISGDEKIELRFWHYFNIYGEDGGRVLLSTDGGTVWDTLSSVFDWNSNAWTQHTINLSIYAGSTIRLGFHFLSSGSLQAKGWYIDGVSIIKGRFELADSIDFEDGIGDWYASKGVWEVGTPVSPPTAHSGSNCAGTVLAGNYPARATSRLISPEITLEPQEGKVPLLTFYHWFNIFSNDSAFVQISVEGDPWQNISPNFGPNSDWSPYAIPLSSFANSTVRFAFYFSSNTSSEARGWYIDDIRFDGLVSVKDRASEPNLIKSLTLHQNFPNPFNPETVILYELPQTSQVEVVIFNLLGERIRTLVNQRQTAGQHRLHWDGRNEFGMPVPSGVYLYRLRAGEFVQTRKMILMQ